MCSRHSKTLALSAMRSGTVEIYTVFCKRTTLCFLFPVLRSEASHRQKCKFTPELFII